MLSKNNIYMYIIWFESVFCGLGGSEIQSNQSNDHWRSPVSGRFCNIRNAIEAMCFPKSGLKYEKIGYTTNNKITNVLNGNRFIYINPPSREPLPPFSYCAVLKCKIFHQGQDFEKPTWTCTNCWEAGHLSRNCTNEPKCAACCPQYFSGNKSILSYFYPSQIKLFDESSSSAEQAHQLTKAIRDRNLIAAVKIREAKTAKWAARPSPSLAKMPWENYQAIC